jgi:hypothetical protein
MRIGDSIQHAQFLSIITAQQPVGFKAIRFGALLAQGFPSEINQVIPSVGLTPLQFAVSTLNDSQIELIEGLLPFADLAQRDVYGLTVFDYIVPVPWDKTAIFFLLLDRLGDEERKRRILRAAASVRAISSGALLERLQWELRSCSCV